jgi:uncharacterized protein YjbJ (UPF0337 family)
MTPFFGLPLAGRNGVKFEEFFMNKDRVEGKAKDVAGRIERQAGEWTGDKESQAKGAAKQVAGKVQNAWGKVQDAAEEAADDSEANGKPAPRVSDDPETEES